MHNCFVWLFLTINKMKNEVIFNELRAVLNEYSNGISQKKKQLTPEFNLLELISPKELQLSRIIAEFLNPKGTHEQGNLFLNSFTKRFLTKYRRVLKSKNISVTTELGKDVEGQIDIVIDFDYNFGVAIENKPFADDQDKQIVRYVDYLKKKYGNENYAMVYLSETGNQPTEKSLPNNVKYELGDKFIVISYKDLKNWIFDCAKETKKEKAKRLTLLLLEIVEYINLTFLKTNNIKKEMLEQPIKKNILEAFEITQLWNNNKSEFNDIWSKTVNDLFNKELPKLVFNELQKRMVIDNNWEYLEGDFNINNKSAKGFSIKKKKWQNFSYGLLRNEVTKNIPKGTCFIFPAILSKQKIEKIKFSNKNYLKEYSNATVTKIPKELWSKPPTIWWTDFSDNEYQLWKYEQWSEIKENGKTVKFIADFFEKLIKVSNQDIEKTENKIK